MNTATTARGRKPGQGSKWLRRSTRFALYSRDGFRCAYCGKSIEEGARLTIDHLLPCELGGTNDTTNLITACLSCNSAKQDRPLQAWLSVLRDRGVNTDGMAVRIRRTVARPLDRAEGRRLAAAA